MLNFDGKILVEVISSVHNKSTTKQNFNLLKVFIQTGNCKEIFKTDIKEKQLSSTTRKIKRKLIATQKVGETLIHLETPVYQEVLHLVFSCQMKKLSICSDVYIVYPVKMNKS